MIYLDLFSGIGGFARGFQLSGWKFDKHYFSEIDPYATAVYQRHFPNAKPLGNVNTIHDRTIESPDVVTFGFPCQDVSLAGKRVGVRGERSSLFFEAIRIIKRHRPRLFIFENVKGLLSSHAGKDFEIVLRTIADIGVYVCEWQLLNTSWILPQHRERVYFVGHLANERFPGVFPFRETDSEFAQTQQSGGVTHELHEPEHKHGEKRVYDRNAPTVTARFGTGGDNVPYVVPKLKIASNNKCGFEIASPGDAITYDVPGSKTRRGRVGKGKANTIDTVCQQGILMRGLTMTRTDEGRALRKQYDRGSVDHGFNEHREGKLRNVPISNTLDTKERSLYICDETKTTIRRLTPVECERLQGFPDDWTEKGDFDGTIKTVSNTQRYIQLGNAVSVPIVKLIADRLRSPGPDF